MTRPQHLSILLVEDDPDYAALVQHWLQSSSPAHAIEINWTDSVAAAKQRLERGGIDVVLLDLSLVDSDGLDTLMTLRPACKNLPVIVLSSADGESTALQAIRYGVEDYLVKNECSEEVLARALSYAIARHHHKANLSTDHHTGRVVAVAGAKGGAGATTIACLLAAELRGCSPGSVLLLDLEPDCGSVTFMTGIEETYSMLDVANNLHRLDAEFWQGVTADAGGVQVVPSLPIGHAGSVTTEAMERAVESARSVYDWVVLDIGRLRTASLRLVRAASDPILITTDALASLHETKRAIDALHSRGQEIERLRLLVNQTDDNASGLERSKLEKVFGVRVFASLPYEADAHREALIHRRLIAETSEFRIAIRYLACELAGIEVPKPKRGLPGVWAKFSMKVGARQSEDPRAYRA